MSTKIQNTSPKIFKCDPSRSQITSIESVTCQLTKISTNSNIDKPSPLEFDKFLPWVALQYEVRFEVAVRKAIAEKYISQRKLSNVSGKKSCGKLRFSERKGFTSGLKSSERKHEYTQQNVPSTEKPTTSSPLPLDAIPITASYEGSGRLVEISIVKSPVKIQQKAIKCIDMCIPFHPSLSKFTITKSGLTSEVLYEVAKMLPYSFLTDVSINDCYIDEGNYYVLLDNISPLKVLSLKRCKINDRALKEIAKRMDLEQPASGLTVLDLGSNMITDSGALYLGDVLRRNRKLLHLCLSDNEITDVGLNFIMDPLKEFQMNQEEIYGMRKRRFQFAKIIGISKQEKIHDKHNLDTNNHETQVRFRTGKLDGRKSNKKGKHSVELLKETAVPIQKEKFTDIFDDDNVIVRDGSMYCIGNLTLCSLNLAYNALDHIAAKKILEVLVYQCKTEKLPRQTGLMRLVLDGNHITRDCDEMNEIGSLLSSVISSAFN